MEVQGDLAEQVPSYSYNPLDQGPIEKIEQTKDSTCVV
jgi:hypothetical protein